MLLYVCAVHSCDILKVMNAMIKSVYCISEHTIVVLWFTDSFSNLVFSKLTSLYC